MGGGLCGGQGGGWGLHFLWLSLLRAPPLPLAQSLELDARCSSVTNTSTLNTVPTAWKSPFPQLLVILTGRDSRVHPLSFSLECLVQAEAPALALMGRPVTWD